MQPQENPRLLQKTNQVNFAKIDQWFNKKLLHRDTSEIIVYLAVLSYALIFSYFTIQKYAAFNTYAWDLGIFDQSLWTTVHSGKLFFSTVEQFISPSGVFSGVFFATHFSPILFVVLPFYALTSSPLTLLVFQSFVLAFGAIPLYFFAKNSLNNTVLAVAFALAYLLYPPLQGVNWFDFHVQVFLPLFFFSAFYFLFKEKWFQYFLFVFLALTVAENVPITVLFIGLYCFWRFRKQIIDSIKTRRLVGKGVVVAILTIAIALAWLFFSGWIQRTYFPFNSDYTQLYKAVDHWNVLGITDDPLKLPLYLITSPGSALNALYFDFPLKVLYVFLLFGPLLFLSFRSSITAISLAWLVPALLSNYVPYYTIGDHYPAYPIAFIFLGAVEAVKKGGISFNLRTFLSGKKFPSVGLPTLTSRTKKVLLVSFVFALTISPLSLVMTAVGNRFPYFADYHLPILTRHDELLQTIAAMVPDNTSILTHNSLFTHFSRRLNAYAYPLSTMVQGNNNTEMHDYIEGLFQKSDYVMTDNVTDYYTTGLILSRVQNATDFGLLAYGDGIYLYKKNYTGQGVIFGD